MSSSSSSSQPKRKTPASTLKQGSLFSFFKKKAPGAATKTTTKTSSSSSSTKTKTSSTVVASSSPPKTKDTSTTTTTSKKISPTNVLWKQVQVGDTIRIWWAQDKQYYKAKVVQVRGNHSNTSYQLQYEDGESEWTHLATETFSILQTASKAKQRQKQRRSIEESSSDSEAEFDLEEDNNSSDEEEVSDFEVNQEQDDDDEDDEEDQWMVTDDEDDEVRPPKSKKRKTTTTTSTKKIKVTPHEAPPKTSSSSMTPRKPEGTATSSSSSSSLSSSAFKTPLRQFANTVSPSTTTTTALSAGLGSIHKTIAGGPPPTPSTSLPSTGQTRTSSPLKALPFEKGAVNVQGAHLHNHLRFLQDPKDAHGRTPDDPRYDPRTLKVNPLEWERLNGGKMTNAVEQWWDLKAQYFDTVLLFKTGKFYEMFHMDADVGVQVLGLSYMKGHVAHAGFPEVGYGANADKLVRAGYKVARVEQTETPDQLKERKARTRKGQKKPAVVNREVCSILSLGTRTFCALDDPNALAQLDKVDHSSSTSSHGAGPLLAIAEVLLDPTTTTTNTTSSSSTQDFNTMETDDNTSGDDSQIQAVCEYGITLVDAARATVTVGQFADDVLRSRLNTLLARLTPSEILLEESASPTLVGLIKAYQQSHSCRWEVVRTEESFPKSTALEASHRRQLQRPSPVVHPWKVEETLEELHRRSYYPRASKTTQSVERWPFILRALVEGQAHLALASFGASLYFLQRHLIDHEILSMGIVKAYIPETSSKIAVLTPSLSLPDAREEDDIDDMDGTTTSSSSSTRRQSTPTAPLFDAIPTRTSAEDQITHLSLDGTTLYNLEILTNAVDHKVAGSLWSKINYCKSPHGARFLRAWLLRPLFAKAEIDRRADAVQELASGAGSVALQEARQHVLGKIGDLDRLLSRIHSMSGTASAENEMEASETGYHPNERAVLYENATYTKRKVNDFSKALTGLRRACQIPELFADLQQLDPNGLLFKLVKVQSEGGCFPEMADELDWFFENFDCDQAAKGLYEPSRGVDEVYDNACDTIERIKAELESYKQDMCQELSPRHVARNSWKYINTASESKDKYLIELPASVQVPDDFLVKGKRGTGHKQVNKYRTSVVAGLVQELEEAIEIQSNQKAKGMQLIFAKFDSKRNLWRAAAQTTAMLDALGSLAKVAGKPGFCRPTIVDCSLDQPPVIDIVQGRHPCVEGSSIHTTEFIPNDLKLGGTPKTQEENSDAARLLLLSGPNMGGKSTLLRQTCLITILAQMGSYVPAESCSLTPVDCIYTRLGASDRILLGQSTFFVELAETAAALRGATRRSLVIMDELGRGTSTFDGTAIAGATVKHLIERSQCLTLFATHYHSLLDEWKKEPMVRLGHMQCMVEDNTNGHEQSDNNHSITFLYTLGPGTCPKSFGINVARLASLPSEVLDNAKRVSQEFEQELTESALSRAQEANEKQNVVAAIENTDWDTVERLWKEMNQA